MERRTKRYTCSTWISLVAAAFGGGCQGGGPDLMDGALHDGPSADAFTDGGLLEGDGGGLLELVDREWTFVPHRGMRCMNGTTTGFAVSPVRDSRQVVIHLQGGGSCFNDESCASVANPDGYDGSRIDGWARRTESYGMLRRDTGPFADATQFFIPYCTGDLHMGSNATGFGGREQVGYENIRAFLARIQPILDGRVEEIFVTGASAGGAGTYLTFIAVREAFDSAVAVHLLSDSGPLLADDVLTPCLQSVFRDHWGISANLPDGCSECTNPDGGGISNLYEHLSSTYPDSRFGLVLARADGTLRGGYGFGYPTCADPTVPMPRTVFEAGIDALADRLQALPNVRVFIIDSNEHVFVNEPELARTVAGTTLRRWIDGLVGTAGFVNVRP